MKKVKQNKKYFLLLAINPKVMRNFLLVFLCIVLVLPTFGQESDDLIETKEANNDLGLLVTDLINGSYSFNYERALGQHISVALGFGYKTEDGLLRLSGLDSDGIKTSDITYSGIKIMPEFRYYLQEKGNNMLEGFYFGAYFRLVNYTSDLVGTFIDSQDVSTDIAFEGKINVISAGFMIGYKLPVTKRISFNFLIAGPGAGFYNFKLRNVIPPPDEFYDALNNALEKYSFLDFLNADFRFEDTNLKEDLTLPVFRYGLTICYSF